MTWKLDQRPYRVYRRNPLVAVVAQLRFQPILKIVDKVPDFQERVRETFPRYAESRQSVAHIQFQPVGTPGVEMRDVRQFEFRTPEGAAARTLTLSDQALALESRSHHEKAQFIEKFGRAVEVLLDLVSTVAPVRLGLRYVNIVDRRRISAELQREVGWQELVGDGYLRGPAELVDLDDAVFANEIRSTLGQGQMTVRYGLLPAPGAREPAFRLDVDRYVEGSFDAPRTVELLAGFAEDVYAVFYGAAGPALLEWMEMGEVQ